MTEVEGVELFNELLNHGTPKEKRDLWRLIHTNDNDLVREHLKEEFEKRNKS